MGKWVGLFVSSLAGGMLLSGIPVSAQVTLSGGNYTQTFDSIGDGLPVGWSVRENATEVTLGESVLFETNATSWAASTGQFRNCASVTNNSGLVITNAAAITQHAFTNRVLAVRQGSSFGDPGAAFVFQIATTVGISNLQFTADFMMLDEESRETVWVVDYGLGSAPSAFTALGMHTNSGAPGTIVRSTHALGSDADDQSEVVTIRVAALGASTGSGSRDTFGLDNVVLSFEGAPAPSIPLAIQRMGGEVVLTWSDPDFRLQAAPGIRFPFTNVPGATSPHTNVISGGHRCFRLVKP